MYIGPIPWWSFFEISRIKINADHKKKKQTFSDKNWVNQFDGDIGLSLKCTYYIYIWAQHRTGYFLKIWKAGKFYSPTRNCTYITLHKNYRKIHSVKIYKISVVSKLNLTPSEFRDTLEYVFIHCIYRCRWPEFLYWGTTVTNLDTFTVRL